MNECTECPPKCNLKESLLDRFSTQEIEKVKFKQWMQSSKAKCSLETIEKDITDFVDYFVEKLFKLKPHDFIAKQQSNFLRQTKENLQQNEFVVISDFAENYSFVVQDEVQAHHWNKSQCTLHPFSIYYKDGEDVKTISFVVVAESIEHNIVSVYLFQTKLFAFLQQKFGHIAKIFFFSDGCAAQYKNRKNFFNLCKMEEVHGFRTEWHFFATHHGKHGFLHED